MVTEALTSYDFCDSAGIRYFSFQHMIQVFASGGDPQIFPIRWSGDIDEMQWRSRGGEWKSYRETDLHTQDYSKLRIAYANFLAEKALL